MNTNCARAMVISALAIAIALMALIISARLENLP
jgi:hypothetical protein